MKPAISSDCSTFIRGVSEEDGETTYISYDVNVHEFTYLAKAALIAVSDMVKLMTLHVGFTIEGRDDTELPECMLGVMTFNTRDWEPAVRIV